MNSERAISGKNFCCDSLVVGDNVFTNVTRHYSDQVAKRAVFAGSARFSPGDHEFRLELCPVDFKGYWKDSARVVVSSDREIGR